MIIQRGLLAYINHSVTKKTHTHTHKDKNKNKTKNTYTQTFIITKFYYSMRYPDMKIKNPMKSPPKMIFCFWPPVIELPPNPYF